VLEERSTRVDAVLAMELLGVGGTRRRGRVTWQAKGARAGVLTWRGRRGVRCREERRKGGAKGGAKGRGSGKVGKGGRGGRRWRVGRMGRP